MNNIRRKLAAGATILGLGGLAGFALGSNPARDPQGAAPVSASPAPEPSTGAQLMSPARRSSGTPNVGVEPVRTGASGAGLSSADDSDDEEADESYDDEASEEDDDD